MLLDKCEGPECPRCGCEDAVIERRPPGLEPGGKLWWAAGRAQCTHCGCRFAFRELPASGKTAEPIVAPLPALEEPVAEVLDFRGKSGRARRPNRSVGDSVNRP